MNEQTVYPQGASTIGSVSGNPETGGDISSSEKLDLSEPELCSFLERLADRVAIALVSRHTEENHLRLVAAVEQAAESFIILDKFRTVKYVNPAFERLMGYSRWDVLNKEPDFLKSDGYPEAFYQAVWDTVTEGKVWIGRIAWMRSKPSALSPTSSISSSRIRRCQT